MKASEMTMIGRIKTVRRELGLTQQEFANKISISYSMVMQMERGVKDVADRTIFLIRDKLGVNEQWLRFGEGRMFVDARRDAFELFARTFNLTAEQQRQVAAIAAFPLDAADIYSESKDTAKRNVARLLKAIDKGSVGRVVNTE